MILAAQKGSYEDDAIAGLAECPQVDTRQIRKLTGNLRLECFWGNAH